MPGLKHPYAGCQSSYLPSSWAAAGPRRGRALPVLLAGGKIRASGCRVNGRTKVRSRATPGGVIEAAAASWTIEASRTASCERSRADLSLADLAEMCGRPRAAQAGHQG
jgi:hypothetical protein